MGKHKKGNVVKAYKRLLQNDRDWDFSFLLELERKKLKRMADCFSKEKESTKDQQTARECALCVRLLDIVLDRERFRDVWKDEVSTCCKTEKTKNENGLTAITFECVGMIPDFPKYVNTRNAARFEDVGHLRCVIDSAESAFERKYRTERSKEILRNAKAWHLYNLVREYRMFEWWT